MHREFLGGKTLRRVRKIAVYTMKDGWRVPPRALVDHSFPLLRGTEAIHWPVKGGSAATDGHTLTAAAARSDRRSVSLRQKFNKRGQN